jgi:hypothetical protein
MSQKQYGVKNFIHIANEYVNPDVTTVAGIEKFLIGWYCFKFNTTPNDDKLGEMTLEELMVLYQMHRIKDDPNYFTEQTAADKQTYEDWLKEEMGEDYASEEANIQAIEQEEKDYTKKVRDRFKELPERIDTDFSQFQKED